MADTTKLHELEQIRASLQKATRDIDAPEFVNDVLLWDQFFDHYTPILRRFAHKLNCPPDEVEDVVCNVWLDVLKYLPTFEYDKARGGFRRWLYRIVFSKAVDAVRRKCHPMDLEPLTTSFWNNLVDPRDSVNDPSAVLLRQELADSIWKAYGQQASPREQEVVRRSVIENQTHWEIAQALGIGEDNVRQIKRRGLLRLKIVAAELFGVETGP